METTYKPWRRLYHEYKRDDLKPDMEQQKISLFAYTRRASTTSSYSVVDPFVDEVSRELDLSIPQASALVVSIMQYNQKPTIFEVSAEHYSDRSAALQVLLDTKREGLGGPRELQEIAVDLLSDLKNVSPTHTSRIAGHSPPSKPELMREWAAQRVKEEYMLLEALRTFVPDQEEEADHKAASEQATLLLEICLSELPCNSRALALLSSPSLRVNEQTRLERAWYAVLLPLCVSDDDNLLVTPILDAKYRPGSVEMRFLSPLLLAGTFEDDKDQEPDFTIEHRQAVALDSFEYIHAVFTSAFLSGLDGAEKSALRLFMERALYIVDEPQLLGSPRLLRLAEELCSLGFGEGEEEAIGEFWRKEAFISISERLETFSAQEPSVCSLLWKVSYGAIGNACVKGAVLKVIPGVWAARSFIENRDLGFETLDEFRIMTSRIGHEHANLCLLQEQIRHRKEPDLNSLRLLEDFTRILIRYLLTTQLVSSSSEEIKIKNDFMLVCLQCLLLLCEVSDECRRILVVDCVQSLAQTEHDLRNAVFAAVFQNQSPGLVQDYVRQQALELCVFIAEHLDGIDDNNHVIVMRQDLSSVASKTLKRFRTLQWTSSSWRLLASTTSSLNSNADADNSMADVELFLRAIKIVESLQCVQHVDDVEVLLRMMLTPIPSERLFQASQNALASLVSSPQSGSSSKVWFGPILKSQRFLLGLFRVLNESSTASLLLANFAKELRKQPATKGTHTTSIIGLLGTHSLDFVKSRIFESLRALDFHTLDFLCELLSDDLHSELVWLCLYDVSIAKCLDLCLDSKFFTGDGAFLPSYERVLRLFDLILARQTDAFKNMYCADHHLLLNANTFWPNIIGVLVEPPASSSNVDEDDLSKQLLTIKCRTHALEILSKFAKQMESNGSRFEDILNTFDGVFLIHSKPQHMATVLVWLRAWLKLARERWRTLEEHSFDFGKVFTKTVQSLKVIVSSSPSGSNSDNKVAEELGGELVNVLLLLLAVTGEWSEVADIPTELLGELHECLLQALKALSFLSERFVLQLCAVYVMTLERKFGPEDDEGYEYVQTEARHKAQAELLPYACELVLHESVSGLSSSSSTPSVTDLKQRLLLFKECCKVDWTGSKDQQQLTFLIRETLARLLKLLDVTDSDRDEEDDTADNESGHLRRWILQILIRCTRNDNRANCDLLTQLGCIRQQLFNMAPSSESLQLVYWLSKSNDVSKKDAKEYLKRSIPAFRAIVSSFRSHGTCRFTLKRLVLIKSVLSLVRALFNSQGEEPMFLEDAWKLIKDLVECGHREVGARPLLEEFVDFVATAKPRLVARLVLRSVPATMQELSWNESPLELRLSLSASYSASANTPLLQASSPSRGMLLLSESSPRPSAQWMSSPARPSLSASSSPSTSAVVSPPRRLSSFGSELNHSPSLQSMTPTSASNVFPMPTQFHLRIEHAILDVLLELFLLFTDQRLVDSKSILLFPPQLDNSSAGPDMLTLVHCLAWIRKSLSVEALRDKKETKYARLALLVCLALSRSLRLAKQSSNPSKDLETLEIVKDRLFGRAVPLVAPSRQELASQSQAQTQAHHLRRSGGGGEGGKRKADSSKHVDRGIIRSLMDKFSQAKASDFELQMVDLMEIAGKQIFAILVPESGQQQHQLAPQSSFSNSGKKGDLELDNDGLASGMAGGSRMRGSRNLLG